METIHLTIPDMKREHCQLTVTNAVEALGARVKSTEPMKAEIELGPGITTEMVTKAIREAGYQVTK